MIKIEDKTQCSGCGACRNICPKNAISMKADAEGFLYPNVDDSLCVKCGLCLKVCPIINNTPPFHTGRIMAAKHKDENIRSAGSSGSMFSLLAQYALKRGGVVFGAAFDGKWNVVHQSAQDEQELDKLRRSKYVQSDMQECFRLAKKFLQEGKTVLFTGTPCQIAGLKNYLGRDYASLITADIICHGVPSPLVWRRFLEETLPLQDISAIDFRYKRFGWDASYLCIKKKDGASLPEIKGLLKPFKSLLLRSKGRLFKIIYILPFTISNLYERPSCHACSFKGCDKYSDFTMADLWGVKNFIPEMYDVKGVSVLMLNSPKAEELFEELKNNLIYKDISFENMSQYNPYFMKSTEPSPFRAQFFDALINKKGSFYSLIRNKKGMKPLILKIIRFLGGAR